MFGKSHEKWSRERLIESIVHWTDELFQWTAVLLVMLTLGILALPYLMVPGTVTRSEGAVDRATIFELHGFGYDVDSCDNLQTVEQLQKRREIRNRIKESMGQEPKIYEPITEDEVAKLKKEFADKGCPYEEPGAQS